MTEVRSRRILSTLRADGRLVVELVDETLAPPTGAEVLVRMEAAPLNPSDLGVLFGPADLANAEYTPGRVVAPMSETAQAAWAGRLEVPQTVGNEGAGTVIAAGDAAEAQALLGKRVGCFPGGTYATHRVMDASACLELPDGVTAEQGASAFINPLTALSFVEHMRREGHHALVHTAAASNLGQMLVRICAEDGIPLVNVVRSPAQVALLKGIGAQHVVDSSAPTFLADLVAALEITGADMGFDAVGGGPLAGQILWAMEQVGNKGQPWSRYGANRPKRMCIYGTLDPSPTVITRNFGYTWDLSGFLVTEFLKKIGAHNVERLRHRVRDGLTTTFASHYTARVPLDEVLTREAALRYTALRTGEKYLILPAE